MKVIDNLDKTMKGIRTVLLKDTLIKKLLYNNSPDGLSDTATTPSESDVEGLIQNNVLVDFNTDENKNNVFNIIAIYGSDITDEDEQYSVTINVDIFVSKQFVIMDENENRLMKLLSRVTLLLKDKKFFLASPLKFSSASIRVIEQPELIGYSISWEAVDGKSNLF